MINKTMKSDVWRTLRSTSRPLRPRKGWSRAFAELILLAPGALIAAQYAVSALPDAWLGGRYSEFDVGLLRACALGCVWLLFEQWMPWSLLPQRRPVLMFVLLAAVLTPIYVALDFKAGMDTGNRI